MIVRVGRFVPQTLRDWARVFEPINALILTGEGSPEGVVTASPPTLYLRTDGGVSTTLYVKTSGTGNTGWTAK